jgi:hypothetical protein
MLRCTAATEEIPMNRSRNNWYLAGVGGFALLVIIESVEPLLDSDKSYSTLRFVTMAMLAVSALVFLGAWLWEKPSPDKVS